MLEALLATIIRPCLGQGTNKTSPLPKDEANELFGTLRAEEILAINTAFREQLRVSAIGRYTSYITYFSRTTLTIRLMLIQC